jgi:hypothetical protein
LKFPVVGVGVESVDAFEPEIMHARVGFARSSTFNATSFRNQLPSHSHSHQPEGLSSIGMPIMPCHPCSDIPFATLD